MWHDIRQAFEWVDRTPEARVAVLQGEGKYFCGGHRPANDDGLDGQIAERLRRPHARELRRMILDMQDTLTSLERCRKPVLAAIAWWLHRRWHRPHHLRRHALLRQRRCVFHHQGNRHRHDRRRGHACSVYRSWWATESPASWPTPAARWRPSEATEHRPGKPRV